MFRRAEPAKLRDRLIVAYLIPSLLLVVIFGTGVYLAVRSSLEDELSRRLIAIAQSVAGPMSAGRDAERIKRLRPDMDLVRANLLKKIKDVQDATKVERIFVFCPEINSRLDTDPEVAFGRKYSDLLADMVEIQQVLAGGTAASVLFTGHDGVRYKYGYAPVVHEDEVVAVVAVAGSAEYFSTLDSFALWLVFWALLMALLVVAVSLVVAGRITRPLAALVEAVRGIGRGEKAVTQIEGASLELDYLATSLDRMRTAIQAREEELHLMLSGIAHEVRNPLGGMELFGGLLKEELTDLPKPLGYWDRIQREMGHLKDVVEDFLNFTRRTPLNKKVVPLQPIVDEVVSMVRGEAENKGVALSVDLPEGLDAHVESSSLHRALLNLLKNAVQATAAGGDVAIVAGESQELSQEGDRPHRTGEDELFPWYGASHQQEQRAQDPPDHDGEPMLGDGDDDSDCLADGSSHPNAPPIKMVVRDTGCGMPKEIVEKATSPFFTTREKGTGLGLSIVRRIMDRHGGFMKISSEPNRGTEVELHFPGHKPANRQGLRT